MQKGKIALFLLLVLFAGSLTGCAFSDWIARLLGNDVLIARYEAETAAAQQAEAYEVPYGWDWLTILNGEGEL